MFASVEVDAGDGYIYFRKGAWEEGADMYGAFALSCIHWNGEDVANMLTVGIDPDYVFSVLSKVVIVDVLIRMAWREVEREYRRYRVAKDISTRDLACLPPPPLCILNFNCTSPEKSITLNRMIWSLQNFGKALISIVD